MKKCPRLINVLTGILVASHCDYRFLQFNEIKLYLNMVDDHSMHNYRLSIGDAVRWRGLRVQTEEKSDAARQPPEWQVIRLLVWILQSRKL